MKEQEPRFDLLRQRMVDEQLIPRGIKNQRVLEAFRKVPRHMLLDSTHQHQAYRDHPIPIGLDQTISQPYIVALMTEALGLEGEERVLEIGTGSGYQAAILAELAAQVFTVERHEQLLKHASEILKEMGYNNIYFKVSDGTKGWPEKSPFQGILVTAASPEIPPSLLEQLSPEGKLVIPMGNSWMQELLLITRDEEGYRKENLGGCRFVPLVGDE